MRLCGPLVKIWLARERVGVLWGVGAVGCAVWVGRGESGIVSIGLELEVIDFERYFTQLFILSVYVIERCFTKLFVLSSTLQSYLF